MAESTHTHPDRDAQVKVVVPDEHTMISLLGSGDELLRALERSFDSDIHVRGNEFTISGTPEETAVVVRLVEELIELAKSGTHVTPDTIERMVHMLRSPGQERPADVLTTNILSNRGRTIRPKTVNQKRYVDIIDRRTVVFGIGPAGTGKTYLAMAKAVKALQDKEVNRIILTRPAVEAGERLGFLPGTLYDKIDPYLRPLYDALYEMIGFEQVAKLIERQVIEIAPLAYMRGRTLNNAFIILDESQNTTREQMKMFLTRIGFGSTAVITGDVTQVDLPRGQSSGLIQVLDVLRETPGIGVTHFAAKDVVRHPLVQRIIEAYDHFEAEQEAVERARRERCHVFEHVGADDLADDEVVDRRVDEREGGALLFFNLKRPIAITAANRFDTAPDLAHCEHAEKNLRILHVREPLVHALVRPSALAQLGHDAGPGLVGAVVLAVAVVALDVAGRGHRHVHAGIVVMGLL